MATYSARFNGGKTRTYQAASDNHAIVRAMATLIDCGKPGCIAVIWNDSGNVAHIGFNNVLGGKLTINGIAYNHATWRESFED